MVWVWIFLGIGLAGLITMASYAVWRAHKASALFRELQMLRKRAEELADLVAQIEIPGTG